MKFPTVNYKAASNKDEDNGLITKSSDKEDEKVNKNSEDFVRLSNEKA